MYRAISQCHGCRSNVIETFTALAGISLKPLSVLTQPSPPRSQRHYISRRHFNLSSRSRESETANSVSAPAATTPPSTLSTASIPWYLQVETPDLPAPASPHLAAQEIPPIPEDAPHILLPILSHLSDQIGLDNLTLLDLRDLDPPPALGANLIMIIGTARSYKHLNTSADRFCRWMRSRYKLTPYADGLLGRNEMKLKLRRKARKIKLAQSVGNTVAMSNTDDGITTGWICVNIGNIENARIPEDEKVKAKHHESARLTSTQQEELTAEEEEYENPEHESEGYIGFGSRSTAPRIVVQMFIEEKRVEMDLEGLWDFRTERRAQKSERADAKAKDHFDNRSLQQDEHREPEATFKPWT